MWKLLAILAVIKEESKPQEQLSFLALRLYKSHKLNVHKTFRGHSLRLLQLTFCIRGLHQKAGYDIKVASSLNYLGQHTMKISLFSEKINSK